MISQLQAKPVSLACSSPSLIRYLVIANCLGYHVAKSGVDCEALCESKFYMLVMSNRADLAMFYSSL